MKIDRMLFGMVMTIFSLALASFVLVPSAFAGDSLNIDVNLLKYKSPFISENEQEFKLTDNSKLDFSNSSIVCPSNNCQAIPRNFILSIDEGSNTMVLISDLKIVDDGSNGDLTPKKRNLVEQSSFSFACSFSDIKEDTLKKTTKYICSKPKNEDIIRNYNSTHYPYTVTATFELPSRHLVLNATETHEPLSYICITSCDYHTVFRNETGKIEVK